MLGGKLTFNSILWSVIFSIIALAIITRVPMLRNLAGI